MSQNSYNKNTFNLVVLSIEAIYYSTQLSGGGKSLPLNKTEK